MACSLSFDGDCVRMIEILLSAVDPILQRNMLFSNTIILNQLQRRYVNMQDADGKTALCRAAEKNHVEAIKLLLSQVDNDQWETTLVSAVKSGNCTILNLILNACRHYSSLNIPILHLACKLNNGRQIVERSSTDEDCITAFLVENLHLNTLSDYNEEGYTPVLLAAHFGFIDCVKYLLSTSKNVDHQLNESTKDYQHNILHVCAKQGRQDWIKDSSSVQSLYDPDEKRVEMALSISSTINSCDSAHFTICQFVLEDHKYKHIADKLLYQQDYNGNTPLHLACQQGNMQLCELFVKHMKESTYLIVIDLKQRTPLHICAKFGNVALIKTLLPDMIDRKIALKALNDSQDIDGKTPLHIACAVGNIEVVQFFIEQLNASLAIQADNRDTPLISACEHGHLHVVNYLLESTNADSTIRNSKGFNALDIAIINHHENIVRRLLACENWRQLMENAYYDDSGIISTPMRELIIFMPEIAYDVIDTKLTMVKSSDNMIEHQVTYDYTFFEDQYRIRNWMYGEDSKKKNSQTNWFSQLSCVKGETTNNQFSDTYTNDAYTLVQNHPLIIAAQCKEMKLMEHEYCTQLRMKKFRRFGLGLFSIFSVIYALFVALYTLLVLSSKHPFFYYNLYNESSNGTLMWHNGDDIDNCQKVATFLIATKKTEFLKSDISQWLIPLLYALFSIVTVKNILLIACAFPRIFRKMSLYFECLSLILCFTNIYDWYTWQKPLNLRCPIQWQLGSVGLLFSWITILTYMQYIPWMNCGLYVVMMQVIFSKFLKFLPVLLTVICGFGFTYYMLLQYQTVYGTPFEALMRTSISLYDLGYEARLYSPSSGGVMLYPVIYFVFIVTEITLAIIITNLLIGLAVGEIPTLKTQAQLNRNIIFYELLFDYEFLHMQLKGFVRYLFRRIRYGRFPFCCCRCRCWTRCNTLADCICCDCAVRTQDYISSTYHRQNNLNFIFEETKLNTEILTTQEQQ
ncbi:unnamed protein product [Adineta steineri]|uniref:Transient receptor potential cation channel subfamily A member 1 n=1 Tax=Adineta steineri TaxID=433720 RepID=A0A819T489_9BILA|nr:unnamed protein product [Adineta steineri]CAF4069070.1 unnamed protein product [Adineta steineri]